MAIGTITRRVIAAIGQGIAAFLAIRVAIEIEASARLELALTGVRDSVAYSAWIVDSTRTTITHQPNDRLWTFQAIEAGIFVALALALLALAAWWMWRRVQ